MRLQAIIAAALLTAIAAYPKLACAEDQYSIVLRAKGEAARVVITAPQAPKLGLAVDVALSKGQERTAIVGTTNVAYYEFAITACGKTSLLRFARAGKGVDVEIHACGVYWFNKIP